MRKSILVVCCLFLSFILTGCTKYDLLVLDTKKEDVENQIINYAAFNNNSVIYRNDDLGLYRIAKNIYHYDRISTIYYSLSISQNEDDVIVVSQCSNGQKNIACTENDARKFIKYLEKNGFIVFEASKI